MPLHIIFMHTTRDMIEKVYRVTWKMEESNFFFLQGEKLLNIR